MQIIFEGSFQSFDIINIQYEIDEKGNPIDIIIRGTEKILNNISDYALYGYNIQPLEEIDSLRNSSATHEALFARLQPFTVKNFNKIVYK